MIKSIAELYKAIDSANWFASVGITQAKTPNFIPVQSFSAALALWEASEFADARSVAWETFRQQVVKRSEIADSWKVEFSNCTERVKASISRSQHAMRFIELTDRSLEEFCLELPFVGAAGELLIGGTAPTCNFHLTQIDHYIAGNWVCGWNGRLSENEFIYPALSFFVY